MLCLRVRGAKKTTDDAYRIIPYSCTPTYHHKSWLRARTERDAQRQHAHARARIAKASCEVREVQNLSSSAETRGMIRHVA